MSRSSPLFDLAVLYTADSFPGLTDSDRSELQSLVQKYVDGSIPYEAIALIYRTKFGTTAPIDRVKEILEVSDRPLPSHLPNPEGIRQKTRHWSPIEDTRLLAALHKFGTDNWGAISQFVGNNRTRSQCSQRWQRGIDPRISRGRWSPEEEAKLLKLVAQFGDKSWIRISAAMGNRSDIQCRYRYLHLQRGLPESPIEEEQPPAKPETEKEGTDPKPAEWPGETIGLDLGTHSASEIFWIMHP
jgi:hypothetical protein